MWWQTLLAQIEHDVAEWLQHDQNLKTWTVEHGPTGGFGRSVATCRWWWCLLVYCYPRRTKEAFLTQWLSWTRHKLGRITRMTREGAASLVQNWQLVFEPLRRRCKTTGLQYSARKGGGSLVMWTKSMFALTKIMCGSLNSIWCLRWFSAPTSLKEKFGETEVWETSCALQISTEQPFERGWTPRKCILDTIRDFRLDVLEGAGHAWNCRGRLGNWEMSPLSRQPDVAVSKMPSPRSADKEYVEKEEPQKKKLTKSSSSEEDGLERSWSERGWGDLSQRFHQAGWLIKEEQGSWHKSVQAWRRARGTDGRAGEAEKREELKKLWYSGNVPSGGLQGWGRNMRGPRGLSRRTSSTSRTEQTWRRRWCWRQTKCGWPSQSDHTKSPTLDVTAAGGEPQVALRGLKKEIRACFSLEKPWKWSTRKNPKLRQVHEQRGDVLSRKPKIDKILKSWVVNEFLEVVCWEIEKWFTCGAGKWSRLIRSFQVSTLQNPDLPSDGSCGCIRCSCLRRIRNNSKLEKQSLRQRRMLARKFVVRMKLLGWLKRCSFSVKVTFSFDGLSSYPSVEASPEVSRITSDSRDKRALWESLLHRHSDTLELWHLWSTLVQRTTDWQIKISLHARLCLSNDLRTWRLYLNVRVRGTKCTDRERGRIADFERADSLRQPMIESWWWRQSLQHRDASCCLGVF